MSKTLLVVALATVACAASIGCSKKGDGEDAPAAHDTDPTAQPTPGPAIPPGTAEGGLPTLHLDDAGAAPSPGDAGADVQPIQQDPGTTFGALVWGTDDGGRLVSFRVGSPDKVSVTLVTGLAAGEKILNVSVRPSTSVLYGLGSLSHLYTIAPATGAATVVGDGTPFAPAVMGQADGFDFNPVQDRIRIHTDVDEDLRVDPTTGKVAMVDGTLDFAPMDPNAGQNPNLVGTAYTNSTTPTPATTMLYAIDSTRNLLTRLPDPDTGMVETVGDVGFDFDPAAGFDISPLGVAYAALHVGAETGLYTIDLTTGLATKVGPIGYPSPLTSIAVTK